MNNFENKEILKKNNSIYDNVIKKYGISSSSVLWDDQQTQYFRFYEIVKYINLNGSDKSVLDIGCGNGELYKFLNFLGFRGEYVGVDVNKKLIDQATKRFPEVVFMEKDILTEHFSKKFNYVLMSGLFNTNVDQSMKWIESFTEKMFSLSKELLVFNAISTHVSYTDEQMFYISPEHMLEFCINNLSPRVTLAHHNLPCNYTIAIYKDLNWSSINKRGR